MSPLRVGTVLRWIREIDKALAVLRAIQGAAGPDFAPHTYDGLQALRDDLLLLSVGEKVVDVTPPPAPPEQLP